MHLYGEQQIICRNFKAQSSAVHLVKNNNKGC